MNYLLMLQCALALAKQIQQDHPEIPGEEKFGLVLDLLISVFGAADIDKYKDRVRAVITVAVDVWKALNAFGFSKKLAAP